MRKILFCMLVMTTVVVSFAGCGATSTTGKTNSTSSKSKFTSDAPCDWCGNTPTMEYIAKGEDAAGEVYHICKEDTENCMICGENKATKVYENLLGMPMYLCNSCSSDMMEW